MKQILVVDDNAEIRQLIKLSLGLNYLVAEADSAAEASIQLEKVHPDLILLDIMMPGLNGVEWCKMIRRWYQHGNVKVIFISALAQASDIADAMASGADGYITKPFSPQYLLEQVDRQLVASV
jgi:CheY-like chemotaxis protein